MKKEFEAVAELLNGSEAEEFLERCYGKCFSGRITLISGEDVCTYALVNGKVISTYAGIPWEGYDVGVKGSAQGWKDFRTVDWKSLSRSTIWSKGEGLELLGSPLKVRQSFSALAYLCKVYGDVLEGSEV